MCVPSRSAKAGSGLAEELRSSTGFTLIEVLIAIGISLVALALGFTCVSSALDHTRTMQERTRAEESGRLFVRELESDLRGAAVVRIDRTGQALALRYTSGEEEAYAFDQEKMVLTRHIRRSPGSPVTRTDVVFPVRIPVRSCQFEMVDGCVEIAIRLSPNRRRSGLQPGDSISVYGRAAPRVAE